MKSADGQITFALCLRSAESIRDEAISLHTARSHRFTRNTYHHYRRIRKGVSFCILSAVCCLLVLWGCGKRGDPTLKAYEKPEAPSEFRAVHRDSGITLLWDFPKTKEQGIKGFHIFKASADAFHRIAFLEKERRTYTDTDFTIGEEYRYRISAESIKGVTNDSSLMTLKPQPPPSPPGGISFSIRHDRITLTWEGVDSGSLYNIYKRDPEGVYTLQPVNAEPLRETRFEDIFDISRVVYYSIRSTTGSPIRDESPASEELMVNPSEFLPSAPRDLMAVPSGDNIYLIWQEPAETWVVSYRVYREIQNQAGYVLVGNSSTPSFIDREKITARRNYRVTAVGPFREGPPAEIRDVCNETAR